MGERDEGKNKREGGNKIKGKCKGDRGKESWEREEEERRRRGSERR